MKILNKFIDEYVLCPVCKLPETVLTLKHKKDLYHHCEACGAESLIDVNVKMSRNYSKVLTIRHFHH